MAFSHIDDEFAGAGILAVCSDAHFKERGMVAVKSWSRVLYLGMVRVK